MKVDPSTPTPTDPLGYRSMADDRAARRAISAATFRKRILIALGILVFLPLLTLQYVIDSRSGSGRETAYRVRCAQNLRQIGQACHLYADANNGHYPVSLSIAFADSQLPISVAFCPNHSDQVPTTLPSHLLDAHSDYIYLGAGLTTSAPPDIIVAYERLSLHDDDGVNILFTDGSTEFVTVKSLSKTLEYCHTQRQLWERRPTGTSP